MKTLLELTNQYKSDVETRLTCIKEEWDNLEPPAMYDEDTADDYKMQIAHWEATLKEIDKVIAKYDEAIRIKLISVLYEWVCPECSRRNKGSGINEQVVCSGCNKPFKIKFQNTP